MDVRPTLYLVEDNKDIRRIFSMLLDANGFSVSDFSTGRALIEACEQQMPDMIVMDLGLPDMDGFDVGEQVATLRRRIGSECVMAAITGRAGQKYEIQARKIGFEFYFEKPIEIREVCSCLNQHHESRLAVTKVA